MSVFARRPVVVGFMAVVTTTLAGVGVIAANSAHAAAGCRVDYKVASQWTGGFYGDVTITNLGDAVNGWTLTWAFTAGQAVTQAWNATVAQSGPTATAKNVTYNAAIAAGGSVNFGFNGSWTGSNPAPASFTLNGVACNGPVTTTAPATTAPVTTAPPTTAPATAAPPTTPGSRTWSNTPDGFASTGGGTTGGAGGTTVTVTSYNDLVRYAAAREPYVIRISGSITYPQYGYEIPIASNKTLVGVGATAELVHGGLHLNPGTHNVIIRNLTIRDTRMADDDPDDKVYDYDGIQMDTADHVWIDHNRIVRMNDGLIDSRKDTTYLTVSWNVIAEGHKAFGIGWTDNVTARITIHHNWQYGNGIRNPSTDNVAYAHLYDNYLQNITGYGNYSRGRTKMVIENSYFENVKDPYYPDSTAQLKQTGSILVGCTGKHQALGSAFVPSTFYSYQLDPASQVPNLVRTYAGPQPTIGL